MKESVACTRLPLDDRGLVRLELARTMVQSTSVFRKGSLRSGGLFDSDFLWAALLSLESTEEFIEQASRLDWRFHCRKHQSLDLLERYGGDIFPWLESFVKRGVLVALPWCVSDCLLALDSEPARELIFGLQDAVIEVPGGPCPFPRNEAGDLTTLGLHPDTKPAQTQPGALRFQLAYAERHPELSLLRPEELTEDQVLEALDQASRNEDGWPLFYGQEPDRAYHALRLLAVRERTGRDWAVLFEVLEGSSRETLLVCRYLVSSFRGSGCLESDLTRVELYEDHELSDEGQTTVCGSWGQLEVTEAMVQALEPGRSTAARTQDMRFTQLVRAYLEENPEFWWPSVQNALRCVGLDTGDVIIVSDAFEHVVGPTSAQYDPEGVDAQWRSLPSQSSVYRSLARALVRRDPSSFDPGKSNLDWRLHLGPLGA